MQSKTGLAQGYCDLESHFHEIWIFFYDFFLKSKNKKGHNMYKVNGNPE